MDCAVTADLNRYLRQLDADAAHDAAVEDFVMKHQAAMVARLLACRGWVVEQAYEELSKDLDAAIADAAAGDSLKAGLALTIALKLHANDAAGTMLTDFAKERLFDGSRLDNCDHTDIDLSAWESQQ